MTLTLLIMMNTVVFSLPSSLLLREHNRVVWDPPCPQYFLFRSSQELVEQEMRLLLEMMFRQLFERHRKVSLRRGERGSFTSTTSSNKTKTFLGSLKNDRSWLIAIVVDHQGGESISTGDNCLIINHFTISFQREKRNPSLLMASLNSLYMSTRISCTWWLGNHPSISRHRPSRNSCSPTLKLSEISPFSRFNSSGNWLE